MQTFGKPSMHNFSKSNLIYNLLMFILNEWILSEANLQLLFTVVESAPTEVVRSNCTIALGDLAVRYPNLLEPWTENVYARLRDPSISVRKNAVLVLSHLILNDMMKVCGTEFTTYYTFFFKSGLTIWRIDAVSLSLCTISPCKILIDRWSEIGMLNHRYTALSQQCVWLI